MNSTLLNMARNKHTSSAGIVFVISGTLAKMACVWFPAHCDKVKQTAEIIETFAGAYGLLMAGDAGKNPPPTDSDDKQNPQTQTDSDPMKRNNNNTLKVLLIGAALTIALAWSSHAQTPAAPAGALPANIPPSPTNFAGLPPGLTPQGSFFSSVSSYFTAFDTNSLTFQRTNEIDVFTGADTQDGITSASLSINYSLWKSIGIEETTRNAGIAGVVVSQQLGMSYSRVIYDLKLSAYLDGGYNLPRHGAFVECGLRAFKALTANTFAGVGLGMQADKSGLRSPIASLFLGVTF